MDLAPLEGMSLLDGNEHESTVDEPEPGPTLEIPVEREDEMPERRRRRVSVNRAIEALKMQHASARTPLETIADELNDRAASSGFLYFHVTWFAAWILWNVGALGLPPFDPFPFGLLTLVVSLEAIFLAIFIMLAQKREAAIAELREELILQVNLRMEEEVTKTLQLVSGLYPRLGHVVAQDDELGDMLQPLDVSGIERALSEQINRSNPNRRKTVARLMGSPRDKVSATRHAPGSGEATTP